MTTFDQRGQHVTNQTNIAHQVSVYATATLDQRERQDRGRMLQPVRRTWIDGFLEDSLHGAALQALGLEERPEAVPDRWGMVVQQPDRAARTLPPIRASWRSSTSWTGSC